MTVSDRKALVMREHFVTYFATQRPLKWGVWHSRGYRVSGLVNAFDVYSCSFLMS